MIALNRLQIWLNSIKNFYAKIEAENENVCRAVMSARAHYPGSASEALMSTEADIRVVRVNKFPFVDNVGLSYFYGSVSNPLKPCDKMNFILTLSPPLFISRSHPRAPRLIFFTFFSTLKTSSICHEMNFGSEIPKIFCGRILRPMALNGWIIVDV